MTGASIAALLLTMLALSAAPGPSDFVLVAHSLRHGFRSALLLIAGIVAGDFIFIALAMLGLAFVAEALGGFFIGVKLAGAGFLLWLAIASWRAESKDRMEQPASAGWSGFSTGLLITLGDPKAILFYMGLLPAFVDMHDLGWGDALVVMLCATLAIVLVKSCYAGLAQQARNWFATPGAQTMLNRFSALVMLAAALFLIGDAIIGEP